MKFTFSSNPRIVLAGLGISALIGPIAVRADDVLGKTTWGLVCPKGAAELASGSDHVLHVSVHQATPKYYETQLTHDITAAVPAGKSLVYKFSARSATKNPVHVVFEKRTAPYTHYLDQVVTLTPEWKPYEFTARIPTAYAKGDLAARLQVGQKAGTLEFKDVGVSSQATK